MFCAVQRLETADAKLQTCICLPVDFFLLLLVKILLFF